MAPAKAKRCGTCELLARSSFPGLHSYGKCPHRDGWVRTHHDACQHHLAARRNRLVSLAMILNVGAAAVGFASFAVVDVLRGNLVSHLLLGGAVVLVALIAWGVRHLDLLSEEPKFQLLDEDDRPPAPEDRGIDLR